MRMLTSARVLPGYYENVYSSFEMGFFFEVQYQDRLACDDFYFIGVGNITNGNWRLRL